METAIEVQYTYSVDVRSDPTYKEWKLATTEMFSAFNRGLGSYLQGMETNGDDILVSDDWIARILPTRNGN